MVTKTHITKQEEGQTEKPVQIRSADPGVPVTDQVWINTTDKKLKFHDGSTVQAIQAAAAAPAVSTKTANYTIQAADDSILGDATAGNITLTLPAAASNAGKIYNLSKIDSSANKVIIDGNASETINGSLSYEILDQYDSIQLVSDGSNWISIADRELASYAIAEGTSGTQTTTSQTLVAVPEINTSISVKSGKAIKIDFDCSVTQTSNAAFSYTFAIFVDGVEIRRKTTSQAGADTTMEVNYYIGAIVPVSTGSHTVEIKWLVNNGTGRLNGNQRYLSVQEIK